MIDSKERVDRPRGIKRAAVVVTSATLALVALLPIWTESQPAVAAPVPTATPNTMDLGVLRKPDIKTICPSPFENQTEVTVWEMPHPPFRPSN